MGSRGPKPLPANVHKLNRNPSKKSFADLSGELQPEIEIPTCPKHLWPEAKKEWRRVGVELEANGLVSKLDRAALALYCQTWAKLVWAETMLARAMKAAADGEAAALKAGGEWKGGDGVMVPTVNGNFTYSHHWVCARQAADQVDKFLQSFGMSPSSRARVSQSNNRQGDMFGNEGAPGGFGAV